MKHVAVLITSLLSASALIGWGNAAFAQITSDGTLPIPTSVSQSGNDFTITNGTQAGSNLFHSFGQFSIPTNGSAVFDTTQYIGIQNIFSRITGGTVSTIDGKLQTPAGANLFLLNPNGIIFGPNATVSLGGSLLTTTGSSIRFADGSSFSANPQVPPVLTVSVPTGVQFGANPGSIQVNGANLAEDANSPTDVTTQRKDPITNKTIGLLGGEITITGGNRGFQGREVIQSRTGRVELGSVDQNSFVNLSLVGQGFTLGYSQVQAFQNIQLRQNAAVFADDGGEIQVQGKQFRLVDGSQLGSFNSTNTSPGKTILIKASDSVEVLGTAFSQAGTEFQSVLFNQTGGAANAGTLAIDTKRLIVQNGGLISVSTFGAGQGGNLAIDASESVDVSGVSATSPVRLFSGISAVSNRSATGNAGNLVINTNRLSVSNGGQISATTFNTGQGGNLTINADTIQLSGGGSSRVNGLLAQAGSSIPQNNLPNATGSGGNLTVNTRTLSVQNGSRISSGTFNAGNAGNLVINADTVQVSGRSLLDGTPSLISASSAGRGAAGNLAIAADRVVVQNGGRIAVSGTSTGIAGNLNIDAPFIELNNQGVLLAETRAGQGNITLDTRDLRLRNNSLISTNATGTATGGNIRISTQTLVALENSDITANAQESFGGRVSIRATAIFGTQFRPFLTPQSDITATSALGPDFSGAVILQTPGIDPSQGLLQLQTDVVDVSRLVIAACSPTNQQATGEFFVTGRGGLPASPSDTVNDDRVLVDLGSPERDRASTTTPNPAPNVTPDPSPKAMSKTPLLQAQGWVVNEAGKVVLVAQSPAPSASRVSSSLFPACK